MSRASPKTLGFAKQLIAYETRGNKSSGTQIPEACFVYEKLRPNLANLMGTAGFRALLARSLALSNAQFPWLRAVHVNADGS